MANDQTAVVFMVKNDQFESVKTRLANDLQSSQAALRIYNRLMKITTSVAFQLQESGVQTYFAVSSPWGPWLIHPRTEFVAQGPGSLGARLQRIHFRLGQQFDKVVFLGSDLPSLNLALINEALGYLDVKDYVVGPAVDGGFYLFGAKGLDWLNKWESIRYSANDTLLQIKTYLPGPSTHFLSNYSDVDDLKSLLLAASEMSDLENLSVEQIEFLITCRDLLIDINRDRINLKISQIEA